MRRIACIALIFSVFCARPVWAQTQAGQGAPVAADADNRMALLGIDKDTGYPIYQAPAQTNAAVPATPTPPTGAPQPGDYGFSPIQDLRQLNF